MLSNKIVRVEKVFVYRDALNFQASTSFPSNCDEHVKTMEFLFFYLLD